MGLKDGFQTHAHPGRPLLASSNTMRIIAFLVSESLIEEYHVSRGVHRPAQILEEESQLVLGTPPADEADEVDEE